MLLHLFARMTFPFQSPLLACLHGGIAGLFRMALLAATCQTGGTALPCPLSARMSGRSGALWVELSSPGVQVHKRGAPPGGGGEVHVRVPNVRSLPPISLLEEGDLLLLYTHVH